MALAAWRLLSRPDLQDDAAGPDDDSRRLSWSRLRNRG